MADQIRSEVVDVPRMPIREFMDDGYLQEVNRRLLHPCGLALEVLVAQEPTAVIRLTEGGLQALRDMIEYVLSEDPSREAALHELEERLDEAEQLDPGDAFLSGIWDCRDDAEGVIFGPGVIDEAKARKVTHEMTHRGLTRQETLGYVIQPAPGFAETTDRRT